MVRKIAATAIALLYGLWSAVAAHGYSFNQIVPDVRQPASASGGSACPVPAHHLTAPGSIPVRWSFPAIQRIFLLPAANNPEVKHGR
jgi:hypothetical protein